MAKRLTNVPQRIVTNVGAISSKNRKDGFSAGPYLSFRPAFSTLTTQWQHQFQLLRRTCRPLKRKKCCLLRSDFRPHTVHLKCPRRLNPIQWISIQLHWHRIKLMSNWSSDHRSCTCTEQFLGCFFTWRFENKSNVLFKQKVTQFFKRKIFSAKINEWLIWTRPPPCWTYPARTSHWIAARIPFPIHW